MKVLAIALLSIGSLDAKGGGGGFSSSSRSSSSSFSSRPSAPAPSRPSSSWSSSSSSKPAASSNTAQSAPKQPASTWSSSSSSSKSSATSGATSAPTKSSGSWLTKPQTSTRPNSSVDRQRYESAVKSGKTFSTRESAVADFKAKEATKYTSRYTTEPSTRPSYIPQRYGNNTIIYNQSGGGYGYYSGGGPGLGTFILYDMMSDAVMLNSVMSRNNYYVGNPPPATVTVQTGSSIGFFGWLLIFTTVGLVAWFFIALFKNL